MSYPHRFPYRSQSSPPRLRAAPYHLAPNRSGHSSNTSSLRQSARVYSIPRVYNPDDSVDDELASYDPHPTACHLYMQQAEQVSTQKSIPTFDVATGSYVPWKCGFLGINRLAVATRTDQLVEPAYCHHLINSTRDSEWCRLRVIHRHCDDARFEVVGYMAPSTHSCIIKARGVKSAKS
ncbi:hypothetical protein D9757_010592 [Collybiopsis confluens]|uniref:Uncharacterized protein n=1 Tax=Collybiopsis confluens TaxID=2823264 RepID=A0A8H5GVC7_9AGAR|nr:hypothetical protein D9757_010592 [Collybiopsis confluens]